MEEERKPSEEELLRMKFEAAALRLAQRIKLRRERGIGADTAERELAEEYHIFCELERKLPEGLSEQLLSEIAARNPDLPVMVIGSEFK